MKWFSIVLIASALYAHTFEVRPVLGKVSQLTETLNGPPVLVLSDFEHAEAKLDLRLNDAGARKLREYTAAHVGDRMAIVVDGKIVRTPVIRAPITGNALQVDPVEGAFADNVVRIINHK